MAQTKFWGQKVKTTALKDLFAPQSVKAFSVNAPGIDNLALSSTDTFVIPGKGEFKVNFAGFFRVAREKASSKNWSASDVNVNMVEINLAGTSKDLGNMKVRINPEYVSAGQVFASGSARGAAKCRIATSVIFEASDMKLSLFNKEPILLMNNAIKSVPPVEDPNGAAHIYYVPLFDTKKPNGEPVAYLTSLRYTVGNYLTREEVAGFRARK